MRDNRKNVLQGVDWDSLSFKEKVEALFSHPEVQAYLHKTADNTYKKMLSLGVNMQAYSVEDVKEDIIFWVIMGMQYRGEDFDPSLIFASISYYARAQVLPRYLGRKENFIGNVLPLDELMAGWFKEDFEKGIERHELSYMEEGLLLDVQRKFEEMLPNEEFDAVWLVSTREGRKITRRLRKQFRREVA